MGRVHKNNKRDKLKLTKCAICGTIKNLTTDHIKPLTKGGSLKIHNLQCLCLNCNQKKGIKNMIKGDNF